MHLFLFFRDKNWHSPGFLPKKKTEQSLMACLVKPHMLGHFERSLFLLKFFGEYLASQALILDRAKFIFHISHCDGRESYTYVMDTFFHLSPGNLTRQNL